MLNGGHHRSASAPTLIKKGPQADPVFALPKRSSCLTLGSPRRQSKGLELRHESKILEDLPLHIPTSHSLHLSSCNSRTSSSSQCHSKKALECRIVQEKRGMFRPVSVEDYKFSRCLGKGAGGKVKLGKNNDGEKVAVKVSRIHESNPSTANKSSESSFDKVLNEAECLHEYRGHNNIVDFVDFMSTDRKYYIVTEYVDGGDLWDFVTSVDRLPEATAKNLFKQLITAVQHMHSRGIGHRDIKPENILVSRDGETAKLCDFGFATKFKEGDELLPGTMGTVRCLAPEMIKRKGWEKPVHDPFQADMWGCGIVLHYAERDVSIRDVQRPQHADQHGAWRPCQPPPCLRLARST